MGMARRTSFCGLLLAVVAGAQAQSQSLEAQTQALGLITKTADEICSIVSHAGNYQGIKVKGEVKAQLSGLIKKMADVGVSGAADFTADQYENVIQSELSSTIQHNADCKLKVFDRLQEKMIK